MIAPGTMAGMTLEHLLASVEPKTDLEKELYRRLSDIDTGFEYEATKRGFDTPEELGAALDVPECPNTEWLESVLDEALCMIDEPTKEQALTVYHALKELQNELPD